MKDEKKHILFLSSWHVQEDNPLLGNFVDYQASALDDMYVVPFIKLIPSKSKIAPIYKWDQLVPFEQFCNPILHYLSKRKAFYNAIRKIKPVDLIHGHVSLGNGWQFREAKRRLGAPLVLTEHGSYFRDDYAWNPRVKYEIWKTYKEVDSVIAVSSLLALDINKRTTANPHMIPNPVDLSKFTIHSKSIVDFEFLHISTLDNIKNPIPIVLAFEKLLNNHSTIKLTIVSDGNTAGVKSLVSERGIDKFVEIHGATSHDELVKFYERANCFVLNSYYETFSIVVAEAWASGLPVISTPVGIAKDCSSDLVELTDGTPDDVHRAMLQVMQNYGKYDAHHIRRKSEEYSLDTFKIRINELYSSLL